MLEHLHHWIETIASYPKPMIAAVEGAAAGAGFSLALACDLIVAASDARFVMSHAKLGLSPDGGATASSPRRCRRRSLKQMLWLAEPVVGRDAARSRPGRDGQPAGQRARRRADPRRAARGAGAGRGRERQGAGRAGAAAAPSSSSSRAERDHFLANLFGANGAEGLQAFVEKRAPRFS